MGDDDECRIQDRCAQEADRIQRFFGRPFFLSATIGIPFCVFKLLFGLTAVRVGTGAADVAGLVSTAGPSPSPALALFGWLVVAWAAADLAMNTGRSALDLAGRPAPFEYCTIAQAGRLVGRPLAFLAIDTFLSFAIICLMLWSGWIVLLTTTEAYLWYAATTMNLISLSVVSIYTEVKRGR
ncbi:hypothetical protein AZH53_10000 [Methanomicrobiaceae archaeon CYW5]|uniref:hypothetical protein n=1 Tax=Methanovulcanius yangii TaxID=1789227 RepID=UPI0029CA84A5|nr:hypothetical protein [Methanovulcanius yangii]MBT8508737.1 hypothetical protein [Methanovulcanius yangii]